MSCACEHFQRPQDVCRNLSMSMFPWFLWKFFGLAVSVGGCERQCLTICICVCEVTLIFNVSLHYSIHMRVSHAPTGRFGNSVRKWTNKGVYSPWDREKRREGGFTEGKGEEFSSAELPQWQTISVCVWVSHRVFWFFLSRAVRGSPETGCFLISVFLLDWRLGQWRAAVVVILEIY